MRRRNTDDERRAAERALSAGGPREAATLLKLRLRAGEIAPWQVRFASFLGNEAAVLLMPEAFDYSKPEFRAHPAHRGAVEFSRAVYDIVPSTTGFTFSSPRIEAWLAAGLAVTKDVLTRVYDPAAAAMRPTALLTRIFAPDDDWSTIPNDMVKSLTVSALAGHAVRMGQGEVPHDSLAVLRQAVGTLPLPDDLEGDRDGMIDSVNVVDRLVWFAQDGGRRSILDNDARAREAFERLVHMADEVLERFGESRCRHDGAPFLDHPDESCWLQSPHWRLEALRGAWSRFVSEWVLLGSFPRVG